MEENKKTLYSAVQPTNELTIGNYIGAIRNFVALQNDYDCFFAIANMHAITVRQNPAELRRRTLSLLALYIACGLNPEKHRNLRTVARSRPCRAVLGVEHVHLRRRNGANDAV